MPTAFSIRIARFYSHTYIVTLKGGTLSYLREQEIDQGPAAATVTPTAEQWRAFRQALDKINIWQWQAAYKGPEEENRLFCGIWKSPMAILT